MGAAQVERKSTRPHNLLQVAILHLHLLLFMQPESDRSDRTGVAAESAMDYYYPMEEEEVVVHEHPRFRRPAHHPWQRQWQWQLLALLSSSSSSPAAAAAAAQRSNHVSWEETAAAHLYSVNLPGVRKEEIRVEVEDARYLAIRTELDGGGDRRSFARKFRLPAMVDADGISAEYTHGVLRVTVPRLHTRARPVVNLAAGAGPACDPVARAA